MSRPRRPSRQPFMHSFIAATQSIFYLFFADVFLFFLLAAKYNVTACSSLRRGGDDGGARLMQRDIRVI